MEFKSLKNIETSFRQLRLVVRDGILRGVHTDNGLCRMKGL